MKRIIALSGLVLALSLRIAGVRSRPAHADDDDAHEGDASRARQGLAISPVKVFPTPSPDPPAPLIKARDGSGPASRCLLCISGRGTRSAPC